MKPEAAASLHNINTVKEAARKLRVGRSRMFDLMRLREIEFVKDGRFVRITDGAIADYIERHTVPVKSAPRRIESTR